MNFQRGPKLKLLNSFLIVLIFAISVNAYTIDFTSTTSGGLRYPDFTQMKDFMNGRDSDLMDYVLLEWTEDGSGHLLPGG